MAQIQRVYRRHQQLGLPGQVFHAAEAYAFDQGIAGVALVPGDGVYYDATTDRWIKPTDAATRLLVTHVVGFDASSFNTDISSPTLNQSSQVTYAAGDLIKVMAYGTIIVVAGEDIVANQDLVYYNHADGRWEVYTGTAGTIGTFRAAVFEAITSGGDGDPIGIRHYGRAQR